MSATTMTATGPESFIELRHISRTYDNAKTSGIRDVSLTIASGEFVAITGPSGAGKSTLLNILGLLDRPTEGEYLLHGANMSAVSEVTLNRARSRHFGFVFQSAFVLGDQTTLHNAALGLRIQGKPMTDRSTRAARALDSLGILERSETDAKLLSGGERQRLAIARAVATRPNVILADEPTGNLDTRNGKIVLDYLKALNAQGTTIVMVTHDPALAAEATRQIKVVDGRVEAKKVRVTPRSVNSEAVINSSERAKWAILRSVADDLSESLDSMAYRKLRTILLILAFAFGIGGMIASIGISQTASAQVTDRLTQAALDEVRIPLSDPAALLGSNHTELDRLEYQARSLPHVLSVGYLAQAGSSTAHIRRLSPDDADPTQTFQLISASPELLNMMGASATGAGSFSALSNPATGDAAVLGDDASVALGAASAGPGSTIWVNDRRVNIIGTVSSGPRMPEISQSIIVSNDVIMGSSSLSLTLVVRTEAGFPAAVADALPVALDPGNPGAFKVETVADLRNLRYGVSSDLGTLIGLISLVLLVLVTVTAGAITYLSVQARSQEIALRRAIGASRISVARLFVLEGTIIGILGGILGSVLGSAATLVNAQVQGWSPVLSAELGPTAVVFGIATGIVSSVAPAISAARQHPSIAIRG